MEGKSMLNVYPSTTEVIIWLHSSLVKAELNAYWAITDSVPTNNACCVDDCY